MKQLLQRRPLGVPLHESAAVMAFSFLVTSLILDLLAWAGLVVVVFSWGRGIGSATGLYFLEPLIFANVPAFLWLSYYGLRIARNVRPDVPA